jgi:hypothetical protein
MDHIHELVRDTFMSMGVPQGGPRNRGIPGYPLPPGSRKPLPDRLPHLDDLGDDEVDRWTEGLRRGTVEISEKIDGAVRMVFGVDDDRRLWVQSKNSPRRYSSREWSPLSSHESIRLAHEALESRSDRIVEWFRVPKPFVQNDVVFGADVLHTRIPNSIPYGPEAIVVHGVLMPGGVTHPGLSSRIVMDLDRSIGGLPGPWILTHKPVLPVHEVFRGRLTRNSMLESVKALRSHFGGGQVEGVVLRDLNTGAMCKIVDRESFTALNRRLWCWRDRLGRGLTESDGHWRPGLMARLSWSLLEEGLGDRSPKSPSFSRVLLRLPGRGLQEVLDSYLSSKPPSPGAIDRSRAVVEQFGCELNALHEDWASSTDRQEFDPIISQRTERAFSEASSLLGVYRYTLDMIGGSGRSRMGERFILQVAMGPNRIEKLQRSIQERPLLETKADQVGVTIGRYQPFTKAHGALMRKLGKRFSKVIVFIAGNGKRDARDPFSMDLREEIVRKSLPDMQARVEIHPAEIDGKSSGYVPGLLGNLIDQGDSVMKSGTAVTIVVGSDRISDMRRMLSRPQEPGMSFDPSLAVVEEMPDQSTSEGGRVSATAVRTSLLENDKKKVSQLMDPHLVSNSDEFSSIYRRMRKEMKSTVSEMKRNSRKRIQEDDESTWDRMDKTLGSNIDRLGRRGVTLSKRTGIGGGDNGMAYEAQYNGKSVILKLTKDPTEARASNHIKGKNSKHIVHIYDVFRFPDISAYGIVEERLSPMSDDEERKFSIMDTLIVKSGALANMKEGDWNGIVKKVKKYDSSLLPGFLSFAERFQLKEILDELKANRIKYDDLHSGNVMKRGSDYVVIDLGSRSESPGSEPPIAEVKLKMNEADFPNLDKLGGLAGAMKVLVANSKKLKDKKGIFVPSLRRLGKGMMGVAYLIKDGLVLKVTTDAQEARTSNLLKEKGRGMPNIVKIFDVFRFEQTPGTTMPVYGTIQEQLEPLSDDEADEFDRLVNYFEEPDGKKGTVAAEVFYGSFEKITAMIRNRIERDVRKRRGLPYANIRPGNSHGVAPDVMTKGNAPNLRASTAKARPSAPVGGGGPQDQEVEREVETETKRVMAQLKHFQIDKIIPQLKHLGIDFGDFHSGNLMKRGPLYVINDIGRSRSGGAEPPVLERAIEHIVKEMGPFTGIGDSHSGLSAGSSSWSSAKSRVRDDDRDEPVSYARSVGDPRRPGRQE